MRLKQIRQTTGKSQLQVAKELNISQQNICRYENNQIEPDIQTLIKLADYFHVTIDYLVEHEVPYLIDKSAWPESKRELLNMIAELDDFESEKIKGIIVGYTQAQKEKPKIIN